MIRRGLTTFTLLSLAGTDRTYVTVDSVVSSILRIYRFTCGVFLRCIFGVTFLELKLSLAFATLDEVTHFTNGFVLKDLKLFRSEESLDLVFHHVLVASRFETFEVSAVVDEL